MGFLTFEENQPPVRTVLPLVGLQPKAEWHGGGGDKSEERILREA